VSAPSPASRAVAVILGVGLTVGIVVVVARRMPSVAVAAPAASAPAAERSAEPAGDPAGVSGPGYTLMDLPAIKKAVSGRGKPVLVHFWASWCGPCLQELPTIEKLARDLKPRGIDVLSLSLDDPARAGDRVVQLLTTKAPSLTRNIVHVADPDAFINAVDPQWEGSIPALFAYDLKGQLRGRMIGEATRTDLDNLIARIAR
jgi:thiol-disulfide isomerase/thioredoxin